jgi:acyl dehydratase
MAALLLTLGRGALTGVGKKPSPAAEVPDVRLSSGDVRIEPGRVRAYAKVCGFAAGRPGLPLTYPHILGFPLAARIMARRDFPLPLMGLVHTSVEITSHRPLGVGDRPELVVYAAGLRPHRRGTEAVFVTEARLGGEVVWEDRSTYLARHRVDGAAPATGKPAPEPALPVREEWRLPGDLGRRHARVSGDYNPIHLSALTARPLGFSRAIAHGMWTVARCVAALPSAKGLAVEFRAPIPLPGTVAFAAGGSRFQVRSSAGLHLTGVARP